LVILFKVFSVKHKLLIYYYKSINKNSGLNQTKLTIMNIYFLMRSDLYIITNNIGLPQVWNNKVLCEAMMHQLNAISAEHQLPYTFQVVESSTI
jgi:hypothetical protein